VYAIWAFVDALEGTMRPIRDAPDEVTDNPAAVRDLAYKTQIAASWMIHTGHCCMVAMSTLVEQRPDLCG
jgi:hypothetical protein